MITLYLYIINRKRKTHFVLDRLYIQTNNNNLKVNRLAALAGSVAGSGTQITNSAAEKRNKSTTSISTANKTYVFDEIYLQSVIEINNDNQ